MIGFNGKYLSAAAIGDMRITAMSQGDKWLITPWLADATKAAILSAFGAEGAGVIQATNAYLNGLATTDREKAQRLANCINEDPMLVCSIVETSKTRWLVGDGKAYIKTDMVVNSIFKYECSIKWDGNNTYQQAFAARTSSASWGIYINHTSYSGGVRADIRGNRFDIPVSNRRIKHTYSYRDGKFYIDEEFAYTTNPGSTTSNNPLFVMASNNNDSPADIMSSDFEYLKLENDTISLHFLPFQLGKDWSADKVSTGVAQATGTCGMIDILTGTFYPNANTEGAFTIALTDKA